MLPLTFLKKPRKTKINADSEQIGGRVQREIFSRPPFCALSRPKAKKTSGVWGQRPHWRAKRKNAGEALRFEKAACESTHSFTRARVLGAAAAAPEDSVKKSDRFPALFSVYIGGLAKICYESS